MRFINKNVTAKQDKMFNWEKIVTPKRDTKFLKVGSLLGGTIYFCINSF